jgi:glyoxylase-like metal-dependent hydrolase (beta-lactamase superfamily II)
VRLPFSDPTDPCHIRLTSNTTRSTSFLQLGRTMLFYIHAPGHSMGHTMLHIPEEKLLFTGDLICYDSVGRVDLPMALGSLQAQSLRRLEELPDNTVVLPGHGRMSTLARERRCNTGLQRVYELMAAGRPVPSVGLNNTGWM